MLRLTLLVPAFLAGCSPEYQAWQAENAKFASSGWSSSGEGTDASEGAGEPATASEGPSSTGNAGDSSAAEQTGDPGETTTTGPVGPPVGDAEQPEIVSVELPAKVHSAGPVPLAVQTERAGSVRVLLDDAETFELVAVGDGLFTGELPVRGAIDNGPHKVEVIASQGEHEDSRTVGYEVSTPKPGTEAWTMEGLVGSRSNRVAVAPAGHLIEVGQTEIDGVPHPTLRMRSSLSGAPLAPEKVLDVREGAVVDVAVLADGRMWVAMNVREPNLDSRARIALLNAQGDPTGTELLGTVGRVVRGIAADAEGGCFAVGVAGVMGDWDIAYWRIDAAGVQTIGETFDYQPGAKPHIFTDLANDVAIDGDVAWVIGASTGWHEGPKEPIRTRAMLVAMDVHTGELLAPVVVAPMDGFWQQSALFGAAAHPDGVLVTGYGSDETNSSYRIETSVYNIAGLRIWHKTEKLNSGLAYGSDVSLDSQGRALATGAVTQDGKLRGYMFARQIDDEGKLVLDHWLAGLGPSEGLGIVRDVFDRIYLVGYITVNGSSRSQITLIHG